jgi:flavin reductase (DIM6/NTAB) family NADH-FMN oxidoreductase RutF
MRVAESPVHFECILRDHLRYGDEAGSGQLITGEVVKVHVSEEAYENGRISTAILNPIGRGAGNDWHTCRHPITLERKMKAQIQK